MAPKLQQTRRFHGRQVPRMLASSGPNAPCIEDLGRLSSKSALAAVCGSPVSIPANLLFENVNVAKTAPSICKFIVANPKALYDKPLIASSFGLDFDAMDPKAPLTSLAPLLPVIYIADVHSEYGTLGYMLNKPSGKTMNDVMPELKTLRQQNLYLGGVQNRGSSFTMLHKKVGFPDNR